MREIELVALLLAVAHSIIRCGRRCGDNLARLTSSLK